MRLLVVASRIARKLRARTDGCKRWLSIAFHTSSVSGPTLFPAPELEHLSWPEEECQSKHYSHEGAG